MKCSIYLAIIGFRYGSLAPGRGDKVSFTELEHVTALGSSKQRLLFLIDEELRLPPELVDRDRTMIDGFRSRLMESGALLKLVRSAEELGESILQSLYEIRLRKQSTGRSSTRGCHEAAPRADRVWMAPPGDDVVEREEVSQTVVNALTRWKNGEKLPLVKLVGAGGFGKTTLAGQICHHADILEIFSGGLLWVTVGQSTSGPELAELVNDLSYLLGGVRPALSDPDAAGAELGRLLDSVESPVLLIIDDIWEEAQLRPFRYGGTSCARLGISRVLDALPAAGEVIFLSAMTAPESEQLVTSGVPDLPRDSIAKLVDISGRWPVLLKLMNGALRRRIARGRTSLQAAGDVRSALASHGPTGLDPTRPRDRSTAVASTIAASMSLLHPEDQEHYLDLAIFPGDTEIPLSVLTYLWTGRRCEALCEDLVGLGLVAELRLDPPEPRIILHDIIREYLLHQRSRQARAYLHARMLEVACKSLLGSLDLEHAAWWNLPPEAQYLWRNLAFHLCESNQHEQLRKLLYDLRWTEAKIGRSGTTVGVEADFEFLDLNSDRPAHVLLQVLRDSASVLGPIEPPAALGATLLARLQGVGELRDIVDRYRRTLVGPRFEAAWPLPDQYGQDQKDVAHAGGVTSCVFSPDGTQILTVSDDRTGRIWHVPNGKLRSLLSGHTGGLWDCAFSPDGLHAITCSDDATLRLWSALDGKWIKTLTGHSAWVRGCSVSPDGTRISSASDDGTARIWNLADGECEAIIAHVGIVTDCAFSPNGNMLATSCGDGQIRIWQVPGFTLQTTFTGHVGKAWCCRFSPDGAWLASGGDDGTVRVWPVGREGDGLDLTGHMGRVWGCAFSPDGMILASSGQDCRVRLWRLADGECLSVMGGHTSWVRGCIFSPDSSLLATCGNDGTVRLWSMPDGRIVSVLAGSLRRVIGCAFSPDGELLVTGGADGAVRLRDAATSGDDVAILEGHVNRVNGCSFSPDGDRLATVGYDGTVRLWSIPDGECEVVLTGHEHWVFGCAFHPSGSFLATTGYDGTVRIWDMPDGGARTVLLGHTDVVNGCAFSPDGAFLASTGYDGTVRLWSIACGSFELASVLRGHTDAVFGCGVSPDSSLLATASYDGTARLWTLPDGRPHATIRGHTSWVRGCLFSPDGKLLYTVSNDATVRAWELDSYRCVTALRVASPLTGLAVHPRGELLCIGGGSGAYILRWA